MLYNVFRLHHCHPHTNFRWSLLWITAISIIIWINFIFSKIQSKSFICFFFIVWGQWCYGTVKSDIAISISFLILYCQFSFFCYVHTFIASSMLQLWIGIFFELSITLVVNLFGLFLFIYFKTKKYNFCNIFDYN